MRMRELRCGHIGIVLRDALHEVRRELLLVEREQALREARQLSGHRRRRVVVIRLGQGVPRSRSDELRPPLGPWNIRNLLRWDLPSGGVHRVSRMWGLHGSVRVRGRAHGAAVNRLL